MWCVACNEATADDPCAHCGAAARLDGRYTLLAVLGRGAAGTTWLADGPSGEVAIKEVSLRGATPEVVDRLRREGDVLRTLSHPGIPRCDEVLVAGRGRHRALWIVQERVRGVTLAEEARGRRYTEAEVVAIAAEVLDILAYLHGLSPPVLHRDVKPANLMRGEDGRLRLIDFGSVRDALEGTLGGSTITGTFGYMAPEQFGGHASPATDLYGLGATMLALLSRREPRELLDRTGRLRWQPHVVVHRDVAAILGRLLDPDAERRPAGAGEAATALRDAAAGLDAVARRGAVVQGRARTAERSPAERLFDAAPPQLPVAASSSAATRAVGPSVPVVAAGLLLIVAGVVVAAAMPPAIATVLEAPVPLSPGPIVPVPPAASRPPVPIDAEIELATLEALLVHQPPDALTVRDHADRLARAVAAATGSAAPDVRRALEGCLGDPATLRACVADVAARSRDR